MKRAAWLCMLGIAALFGCSERSPTSPSAQSKVTTTQPQTQTVQEERDELAPYRDRLRAIFVQLASLQGAEGLGRALFTSTELSDRAGLVRLANSMRDLDRDMPGWEQRFQTGTPKSIEELRRFREFDGALQQVQRPELAAAIVSLADPRASSFSTEAIARAADQSGVDASVLRQALELPEGFDLELVLAGLRRFSARSTVASLQRLGVHGDVIAALVRGEDARVETLWHARTQERVQTWANKSGLSSSLLASVHQPSTWREVWGRLSPAERAELWRAVGDETQAARDPTTQPGEVRTRVMLLSHGYPIEHVRTATASRDQAAELLATPEMVRAAYLIAVNASLPLRVEHIALLRAGRGGEIPRDALLPAIFEFGRILGFDGAAALLGVRRGEDLQAFAQRPAWDAERSISLEPDPGATIEALRARLAHLKAQVQQDLASFSSQDPGTATRPAPGAEPGP